MSLETLWHTLQSEIKDVLGVNKYEIWIQKGNDIKLRPLEFGDTWILFHTNNDYFAQHVQQHIWPDIQKLLLALYGFEVEFRYVEISSTAQQPQQPTVRHRQRRIRTIPGIPPEKILITL